MEIALQVQQFIHKCVLMHRVLRDEQPLTDMEYRLLNAHLQIVAAELALKKFRQVHAPKQIFMASG